MALRFSGLFIAAGVLASATYAPTTEAGFGRSFKKVSHATKDAANTVANGASKAAGTVAKEAASDLSKTSKFTTETAKKTGAGLDDAYATSLEAADGAYEAAEKQLDAIATEFRKFAKGEFDRLLREFFKTMQGKAAKVITGLTNCSMHLVKNAALTAPLFAKVLENQTQDDRAKDLISKLRNSSELKGCMNTAALFTAQRVQTDSAKAKTLVDERADQIWAAASTPGIQFKSFSFGLLLEASAPVVGAEGSIGFSVDINKSNPAFRGWIGLEGTLSTQTKPGASGSIQAALWTTDANHMTGPSITLEGAFPIKTEKGDVDLGVQIYLGIPKGDAWKKAFLNGKPDVAQMFPLAGIGVSVGMGVGGKAVPTIGVGGGYTWTLPKFN